MVYSITYLWLCNKLAYNFSDLKNNHFIIVRGSVDQEIEQAFAG